MSKIEEALKKAIDSGVATYPGNMSSSMHDRGNGRGMMVVANHENAMQRKMTSIKEIALMKDKALLDTERLSEMRIISQDRVEDKVANSFRDLRTSILHKTQGRNAIILITSCSSDEGGAVTALNLATAFAFDESKTSMLIDCDFNNPRLDGLLNLNVQHGLIDYLENEDVDGENIMHETGVKRLRVIPAGNKREVATEYFTSIRMKKLISDLFSRYPDRYIFINSGPVSDSADTKILAELSDYVLLVVPYGKATIHKIKESVKHIEPDKHMGVIFSEKPKLPRKMKIGLSLLKRNN